METDLLPDLIFIFAVLFQLVCSLLQELSFLFVGLDFLYEPASDVREVSERCEQVSRSEERLTC